MYDIEVWHFVEREDSAVETHNKKRRRFMHCSTCHTSPILIEQVPRDINAMSSNLKVPYCSRAQDNSVVENTFSNPFIECPLNFFIDRTSCLLYLLFDRTSCLLSRVDKRESVELVYSNALCAIYVIHYEY